MMTNTELLAIARKQIGNGGGKYRDYVHASGDYCNMFVFWLYDANGCGSLFALPKRNYYRTYCPDSIKWCRENLAEIPPYIAMACDISYFDWEPNGIPNHIGVVDHPISTEAIATIEGNTNGGKVAAKKRNTKYITVYRTHFKGTYKKEPLAVDGEMGYQTIGGLQAVVGASVDTILGKVTVRKVQAWAGVNQDAAWGKQTSKGVQKIIGTKVDGAFGENSVKALQKYINAKLFKVTKKTTSQPKPAASAVIPPNAQKLINKMKDLAWAYGTAKSKYAYKGGSPKSACVTAMKKYGYTGKKKQSDCGNFVNTVVRETGIDKSFTSLHAVKTAFPKSEKAFNIVHSGKAIPAGLLKPGDIIRYKKTNNSQHAMFYFGDGKVCDAGHYNRFGNIRKDEKRYAFSNVKKNTIQVLRVKE